MSAKNSSSAATVHTSASTATRRTTRPTARPSPAVAARRREPHQRGDEQRPRADARARHVGELERHDERRGAVAEHDQRHGADRDELAAARRRGRAASPTPTSPTTIPATPGQVEPVLRADRAPRRRRRRSGRRRPADRSASSTGSARRTRAGTTGPVISST
jgi:hypothetical protein